MFPLLLQTVISNQMRPRRLRGGDCETVRARRLTCSAGSARLDICVHDCRWLRRVTDQWSVIAAAVSAICITVIAPHPHPPPSTAECSAVQDTVYSSHSSGSVTASHSDSAINELASLEQAATTLNDSNAVSCMVPVFAGKKAVRFPGIRERKITGIPRRPGMQTLVTKSRQ